MSYLKVSDLTKSELEREVAKLKDQVEKLTKRVEKLEKCEPDNIELDDGEENCCVS